MRTSPSIRTTLLILSIIGLAISGYLSYVYITGTSVRCVVHGIFSGCGEVQNSEYAKFYGIPTPLFGVLFYLFILLDQIVLQSWHEKVYTWRSFVWFVALFAFLFSLFLTFLEAFVIEAWCAWCVASALVSTAMFIIISVHFRRQHRMARMG